MGKKECPVNFEVPPNDVKYGSLLEKDQAGGPAAEGKKRGSLKYGKDPTPKHMQFPFLNASESAQRILQTDSKVREGAGNVMGRLKVAHDKVVFPGWLIELDDEKLNALMELKTTLASSKKLCDIIDPICSKVETLGAPVPKEEIIEILRRTASTEAGVSFPHFMLALGSPKLAREKGVFQDPIPFKQDDCAEGDSNADANKKGKKQKRNEKEILERLYHPYKYDKMDTWPLTEAEAKKMKKNGPKLPDEGADATSYSPREQLFFSALLIFEMYHTIKAVESLYFQSDNIPMPKEKVFKDLSRRGFGVEDAGTKKLGFAEWDRPLPKMSKASPYVASLSLVTTRWEITKPNEREKEKRRTRTQLQPMHIQVSPPTSSKSKGKIKVTEDKVRIKETMDYLASTGNCVAMLPNSHCIVHLSDTFIQKLEEIKVHALDGPPRPDIKAGNDMIQLIRAVHHLLNLHGLPPQINKMKQLIDFNCALCLRKICDKIRQNHWEFINERQVEFRNVAWKLMHVERIPCGQLRENFLYSFNTYLPFESSLPIINDQTPNAL